MMNDLVEVTSWEPRNAVERRISELPVIRQLTFRGDRGRVALEQHTSYRQAIMAHMRGYRPDRACGHCRDGHGPMTECVRLEVDAEHVFAGACTNCHWGGQTSRCSFYLPPTRPQSRVRSKARSARSSTCSMTRSCGSSSHQPRPHTTISGVPIPPKADMNDPRVVRRLVQQLESAAVVLSLRAERLSAGEEVSEMEGVEESESD